MAAGVLAVDLLSGTLDAPNQIAGGEQKSIGVPPASSRLFLLPPLVRPSVRPSNIGAPVPLGSSIIKCL